MNKMDSHAIEYIANEIENSEYEYRIRPLNESPDKEAIKNGNHVIPDTNVELGKKQGATLYIMIRIRNQLLMENETLG